MRIQNPLDDYQSYSVHYIMLACRSTVAASAFANDDETIQKSTLQAINDATYLGSPINYDGSKRDVFLVIDTRRFAQFSIENLKYDVYVNGLMKGGSTSNLTTDLSMTVIDSVGISFANFLQWLMDVQMETNFDGLVFMLRTVFVGHKPDGSTTTIQSETIPMHLQKCEIDLSFARGAYNLEFIPNMNFDVNRYARFMTISTASGFNSGGTANSIVGIVNSFQQQLNKRSEEWYSQVQDAVAATGLNVTGSYGRKVEYMITLPASWDFPIDGSSVGKAVEKEFDRVITEKNDEAIKAYQKADKEALEANKERPKPPTPIPLPSASQPAAGRAGAALDTFVNVPPNSGITSVLNTIFSQTPRIQEMGNFKTRDQQANITDDFITFYKFVTGITSNDTTMQIHIDVVEFKVPNILIRQKTENANAVSTADSEFFRTERIEGTNGVRKVPKNFLEYDYIFTGKNLDILNFEMKIEDFQFLLATNLATGPAALLAGSETTGTAETADEKGNRLAEVLNVRRFDPIVLPQDTAAALANFSQYANFKKTREKSEQVQNASQLYTRNLSAFYAMSPITIALTIRGNPLIMHKFNMGKLGMHFDGAAQPKQGQIAYTNNVVEYRTNLENEILRMNSALKKNDQGNFDLVKSLDEVKYATSPVFAKINIKGPTVDFRTNSELPGDYASSVLSDNYYIVFKVTNMFQGHTFTQELELFSYSIFGRNQLDKSKLGAQLGLTKTV